MRHSGDVGRCTNIGAGQEVEAPLTLLVWAANGLRRRQLKPIAWPTRLCPNRLSIPARSPGLRGALSLTLPLMAGGG